MLKTGNQAPQIAALDIYSNEFNLENLKGKKIYLSFLRVASCPFCNLRVNQVIQKHDEWNKKGIITVAIFASSNEEILKYAGKQHPAFTVIGDPKEQFYKQYGIGKSYPGMFKAFLRLATIFKFTRKGMFTLKAMTEKPILPGDFLIDENGIIQKAYYGKDFGDHIPFSEIDNW